jgi:hypothetical protein
LIRLVVGTVFLWFMWTCALYEFVLIAVTDDSNDLVASKAFFYICTGFFQGVVAVVMAALDWPRYYPFVHSYFALKRCVSFASCVASADLRPKGGAMTA